jgi:hypothetical protein
VGDIASPGQAGVVVALPTLLMNCFAIIPFAFVLFPQRNCFLLHSPDDFYKQRQQVGVAHTFTALQPD